MGILRELQIRAGQIVGPVIGMTMVVYFAYHAVQGDRGLIALGKLHQEVGKLQARVLDTRAARMAFDQKVVALESGNIDPDLLEERARFLLGYGYADEILVMTRPLERAHVVAETTTEDGL